MTPKPEVIYSGRISGISFGHYKFRPDRLRDKVLIIVPEPNNPYDPDAIRLLTITGIKAVHIGYIPRQETWRLHAVINAGRELTAIIDYIDNGASAPDMPHILVTTPFVAPPYIPPPLNPPGSIRRILK